MNIINIIKINTGVILKYFLSIWGALSAITSLLLAFISWDEFGITKLSHKILILIGMAVISVITAVITILLRKEKAIFGDINKGLSIKYDDIINLGFNNSGKSKKIIVIPVNRCFDLSCENNLVSEASIHGQWINKYISTEDDRNEIHNKIESILKEQNAEYVELLTNEKKGGYLKRYAPGTVVELKGFNDVVFYLCAVSEFDSDLKAICTEVDYYKALQNLIEYYDAHGQCKDMYCPVIGDHIIRPTKPTDDILHFMVSVFKINKARIHGKVHIVVYNKMKDSVSILKYCD